MVTVRNGHRRGTDIGVVTNIVVEQTSLGNRHRHGTDIGVEWTSLATLGLMKNLVAYTTDKSIDRHQGVMGSFAGMNYTF